MATYTQEAKRLVLVALDYDSTAFDVDAAIAGTVGFINANGAAIGDASSMDSVPKVVLGLATDDTQFDAGKDLNMFSEGFTKAMVKKINYRAYQAPYESVEVLEFGAGTYDTGEEIVLGLRFDQYGSVSMKNIYNRHGVYYTVADATSSATVVAALVSNLNKNLAKDQTPRAQAYIGSAVTADVASAMATATGYTVVNGATSMTLTGGDTLSDATTAGWIKITDSNSVEHVIYATFTTGNATVTFDRPYTGASDTARADSNLASFTTADLILVGETQVKKDFHNMPYKVSWKSSITKDTVADSNVTKLASGASAGSGYGPDVALIEEFANSKLNMNQFVQYPRRRDPRLNTNTAKNYDVVNVQLATTKEGSGSNVTSIRELQIFVATDAGTDDASDLAGHLADWSEVTATGD